MGTRARAAQVRGGFVINIVIIDLDSLEATPPLWGALEILPGVFGVTDPVWRSRVEESMRFDTLVLLLDSPAAIGWLWFADAGFAAPLVPPPVEEPALPPEVQRAFDALEARIAQLEGSTGSDASPLELANASLTPADDASAKGDES